MITFCIICKNKFLEKVILFNTKLVIKKAIEKDKTNPNRLWLIRNLTK